MHFVHLIVVLSTISMSWTSERCCQVWFAATTAAASQAADVYHLSDSWHFQ